MAIQLRSRRQIEKMREAGRLVAQTFEHLRPHIRPGVTTRELDRMAEQFIRKHGATPAYKGYRGQIMPFPASDETSRTSVPCGYTMSEVVAGANMGIPHWALVGRNCPAYWEELPVVTSSM